MGSSRAGIDWRQGLVVILMVGLITGVGYLANQLVSNQFLRQLREAEEVLREEPNNFSALMEAGVAAYNLKRYLKAVDYYTRATGGEPDEAVAWNNLANAERDLKRFEEAEEHYQKAVGLDAAEAQYYVNLADLYRLWSEKEPDKKGEIEKILLEGLKVLPKQPKLLSLLASYYEGRGETKKAEELRRQLVK